jgi:two-component system invasion response regulator UvrY
MIRLLLADDHPIVREGLKFVVSQNRDIEVVGEAEDGEATLDMCSRTPADVLLLDVSMPGPGILGLIRTLRASRPGLRLLVLSVHPEQHYARRVLKAGADGYLTKNHSSSALADAIRQVYHGHKYVTPSLAEELALHLSAGRPDTAHDALSNREYEVFLQLGAGKRVDEVARRLGLSSKTVRTYRSRIIEKMNFRSTAEIIFYAVRHGLVTEISQPAPQASGAVAREKGQGKREKVKGKTR